MRLHIQIDLVHVNKTFKFTVTKYTVEANRLTLYGVSSRKQLPPISTYGL